MEGRKGIAGGSAFASSSLVPLLMVFLIASCSHNGMQEPSRPLRDNQGRAEASVYNFFPAGDRVLLNPSAEKIIHPIISDPLALNRRDIENKVFLTTDKPHPLRIARIAFMLMREGYLARDQAVMNLGKEYLDFLRNYPYQQANGRSILWLYSYPFGRLPAG